MTNWIHISEQLPPINEPVLFYHVLADEFGDDCSDVYRGWYEGNKTMGAAIVMETTSDPVDWLPCTYWMPLPKRRKEHEDDPQT